MSFPISRRQGQTTTMITLLRKWLGHPRSSLTQPDAGGSRIGTGMPKTPGARCRTEALNGSSTPPDSSQDAKSLAGDRGRGACLVDNDDRALCDPAVSFGHGSPGRRSELSWRHDRPNNRQSVGNIVSGRK